MRILLVDDDRLVLATLAQGLRTEGYDLDIAADGQEALTAVRTQKYDIAILDIRMPDMTGVELARRMKQICDTPILFLSAYSEKATVESALAEGGLGYAVKPIDIRQLVPAIEAALARASDLRKLADMTIQLQQALSGGRNTSTAVGILMERYALSKDASFERLRSKARSSGCKLEVLAGEVIDSAECLNSLNGQSAKQSLKSPENA